jgi:hypothetical protein
MAEIAHTNSMSAKKIALQSNRVCGTSKCLLFITYTFRRVTAPVLKMKLLFSDSCHSAVTAKHVKILRSDSFPELFHSNVTTLQLMSIKSDIFSDLRDSDVNAMHLSTAPK